MPKPRVRVESFTEGALFVESLGTAILLTGVFEAGDFEDFR